MNDKTRIVGIALGVIAIVLSLIAIGRPTPEKVIERMTTVEKQQLGALAGPDIPYPYLSFGGVRQWAGMSESFYSASSTLCVIQAPSATTTLVAATLGVQNIAGTNEFEISHGKVREASTTRIALGTVTSDLFLALVGSTTPFGIVEKNTFINFKVATSSIGNSAFTGRCSAVFREI
mgnify:CR=1 FL=1